MSLLDKILIEEIQLYEGLDISEDPAYADTTIASTCRTVFS